MVLTGLSRRQTVNIEKPSILEQEIRKKKQGPEIGTTCYLQLSGHCFLFQRAVRIRCSSPGEGHLESIEGLTTPPNKLKMFGVVGCPHENPWVPQ